MSYEERLMRFWQDFLDSIDTGGGHIFMLSSATLIGVVALHFGVPKAEDLFVGAGGALLLALKVAGSNKTRRDRPTDVPDAGNVDQKQNG